MGQCEEENARARHTWGTVYITAGKVLMGILDPCLKSNL